MTSTKLNLAIGGMHCAACVNRVTRTLQKLPGVQVERVGIGSAEVAYDPAVASPGSIAEAVRSAGYDAQPGV